MSLTLDEWTEREISAIHRENFGSPYSRMSAIKDRVIEAHIEASLKPVDNCQFHNQWGFCKLPKSHKGTHTVIFLGDDDE